MEKEAIMSPIYTGEVRDDGSIVFDAGSASPLPPGTRVRIEPLPPSLAPDDGVEVDPLASTRRMLLSWARRAEELAPELPPDLAEHHDHYAHGKPRE
jgi:hypothetical protein